MASMKDAYIASENHTAILYIDGTRVMMGYPNGSVFLALRDGLDIIRKLNPEEVSKHAKGKEWRPLR